MSSPSQRQRIEDPDEEENITPANRITRPTVAFFCKYGTLHDVSEPESACVDTLASAQALKSLSTALINGVGRTTTATVYNNENLNLLRGLCAPDRLLPTLVPLVLRKLWSYEEAIDHVAAAIVKHSVPSTAFACRYFEGLRERESAAESFDPTKSDGLEAETYDSDCMQTARDHSCFMHLYLMTLHPYNPLLVLLAIVDRAIRPLFTMNSIRFRTLLIPLLQVSRSDLCDLAVQMFPGQEPASPWHLLVNARRDSMRWLMTRFADTYNREDALRQKVIVRVFHDSIGTKNQFDLIWTLEQLHATNAQLRAVPRPTEPSVVAWALFHTRSCMELVRWLHARGCIEKADIFDPLCNSLCDSISRSDIETLRELLDMVHPTPQDLQAYYTTEEVNISISLVFCDREMREFVFERFGLGHVLTEARKSRLLHCFVMDRSRERIRWFLDAARPHPDTIEEVCRQSLDPAFLAKFGRGQLPGRDGNDPAIDELLQELARIRTGS